MGHHFRGLGGARVGSTVSGTSTSAPGETDLSHELFIGDVTIVVEKRPGAPITMTANGKRHGTLEREDEVIIDKERLVSVNGEARAPQ